MRASVQDLDIVPAELEPAGRVAELQRYVPLIVWGVAALTVIFICLRILGTGFLPAGDARRHVAKAFTDRPYTEIVVMRPEYTMDHSPGWECLLRFLRKTSGWNADALMSFSIAVTLLCMFLAPLPWVRRPEAWLAALLAQMVAIPELMGRLTQARPYLLSEAILIAILFSWTKQDETQKPSWPKLIGTSIALTLSVWMHGAWYLWVLPIAAFLMSGKWRSGMWLSGCWIAGTIAGALLTSRPIEFLKQALLIASSISKEHVPTSILVGEFRPSYGEFTTLAMVLLVSIWRRQQNTKAASALGGPVFWMMVIAWILGFKADRFWADWGVPAVLVWLTLVFEEMAVNAWPVVSWRRVVASGVVAVPLFWHSTNDLDRRYSYSLNEVFLDFRQPELKPWMPDSQGIFYSDSMVFFYNTFYKNPQGDWRYIVGMEPALMPEPDLQVFRSIQMNPNSFKAYEPWVQKLSPADRLEVSCSAQPNLPELEWTNAATGIWIGRLPKGH
ncbi:MAG TPA: hypothetical protein VL793_09715 [Patescibacteria group bacterium]|nr:hypothetical protein [Patescibacteria group bacterium]